MSMPIYLDHNATTPLLPEVVDAMLPYLREHFGNPSSNHPFGARARAAIDEARAHVARLIGSAPEEICFTSGGTEANNLAIRGIADASSGRRRCITSTIEHPATTNPCQHLAEHGWGVERIAVDEQGRVRMDMMRERIAADVALVTVMHANNETGTIEPIREIADIARAHGALVHTDAAQSVGKLPVNVDALGVDLLTVAGHKLNAPKGVGALYVRRGTSIQPFLLGAGHERGLRPGTENVASIVGLGVACQVAAATLETRNATLRELRDRLWGAIIRAIPEAAMNARTVERLPNTLSLRFPHVHGSALLAATPEIAASTGSACHEGHETPSSVLLAMGLAPEEALRTVRLSVGTTTTARDIELAAEALVRAWRVVSGRA